MDEEVGIDVGSALQEAEETKTLTKTQLTDLVKKERFRAAEKARAETEAKYQAEMQAQQGQMPQFDPAEMRRQVKEELISDIQAAHAEAEKERQTQEMRTLYDQYQLKMGKGSQLFDDFEEIMGDFEPGSFPDATMLAAQMDNTAEIMYELTRNPSKLQDIDSLARKSPKLAMKELERLEGSINQNLQAKVNTVSAPQPLSKIKSSSVGADTGKMTLKDFKNASYLRG